MNATYRVVIKGAKVGFTKDQVAKQLAPLFKVSEDKARAILEAVSYVVKTGVDLQTTEKYQAALEQRGCICVIEPETAPVKPSTTPTTTEPPAERQAIDGSKASVKCHKCGFQLPVTAKFCRSCGGVQSTQSTTSNLASNVPTEVPHTKPVKKSSRTKYAIISIALIASTVAMASGGYMIWKKQKIDSNAEHVALAPTSQQTPVVNNTVPNSAKTVAGDLIVVENKDGGNTLNLRGKVIFDGEAFHINIVKTFNFSDRTVVFFSIFDYGNSSDTSSCQFLTVQQDEKVTATVESVDCKEDTKISVNQEEITVTQPYVKYGDSVWKFSNGVLTQVKKHDDIAENKARETAIKNADQLEITEDTPVRIRGTLKLEESNGKSKNDNWVLKFPRETYISGEGFCNAMDVKTSMPFSLEDFIKNNTIPPSSVQGEAEFDVTFSCPHAGVAISSISFNPPIVGTWLCRETSLRTGKTDRASISFNSNGNFSMDGTALFGGNYRRDGHKIFAHLAETFYFDNSGSHSLPISQDMDITILKLSSDQLNFDLIAGKNRDIRGHDECTKTANN